jgi:phage host-nuclease inhibitor protein Gam
MSVGSKVLENESAAARDRILQQHLKEKVDLLRTVGQLEAENQRLIEQNSDKAAQTEKENLELLVEGMTEESEQLKGQLAAKDSVLSNMKKDLEQLSEIIQEMTVLNKELNDKIARLNSEMETKNKEHYQAMLKAQHIEETEKALAEQTTETQKS